MENRAGQKGRPSYKKSTNEQHTGHFKSAQQNQSAGSASHRNRKPESDRPQNSRFQEARTSADRTQNSRTSADRLQNSRQGGRQKNTAAPENKPRTRQASSVCKYAGKCGGCQFLDQPYESQLKTKRDHVAELIQPFCKLDSIIGMDEPKYYRNKVHAVFGRDSRGNILAGTYIQGTHHVVDVDSCLLDNQKADAIIRTIKKLIPSFKIKTFDEDTSYGLLRHVLIRTGRNSGEIMVVLVLASPVLPSKNNFVKALRKEHPEITTVVLNINDRRTSAVLGSRNVTLYGKGYLEDTLCGKTFHISPSAFYQVNPVQTEKLYRKAIDMAQLTGQETILDAYCGIGTIGIIASDKAKRVIAVEINKEAVRDAVTNIKLNKAGNVFVCAEDAGQFMTEVAESGEEKVDVVFMDPPRAGSDEAFLSSMVRMAPGKVVYISCNPETLARDLKYLTEHGYEAKKAVAVDMFPWTGHVETVVRLCRVDS